MGIQLKPGSVQHLLSAEQKFFAKFPSACVSSFKIEYDPNPDKKLCGDKLNNGDEVLG